MTILNPLMEGFFTRILRGVLKAGAPKCDTKKQRGQAIFVILRLISSILFGRFCSLVKRIDQRRDLRGKITS